MTENKVIIAAVVSGVCGTALLIFVGLLIYWCLKHRQDHEKLLRDEERTGTYRSYSSGQLSNSSLQKAETKSKSPMLWRKTILFAMPHKKVETVQPESKGGGLVSNSPSIETDETDFTNDNDSAKYIMGAEGGDDQGEKLDCKLGRINFTLAYDFPASTLVLKINNAAGLPAKDFSGTSDPYVKVMLLPDKKRKMQTKIKRKTLNPRWNEIFLFEGFPFDKVQQRVLYLEVLDFDRFSRDDPIGEIALPLNNVNLTEEHTYIKHLQPCSISRGKLGELLLSLCYQPTIGRITVVILKGRDLQAKDIIGTSDPYVKLWLYHGQKRLEKKKTTVKKRTLNPVFNESFIFDVPLERIRDTSIHISCMDYDSLSRNDLIGQVIIGARSGPSEMKHWNDMIAKPRQAVAQWHLLKM